VDAPGIRAEATAAAESEGLRREVEALNRRIAEWRPVVEAARVFAIEAEGREVSFVLHEPLRELWRAVRALSLSPSTQETPDE
jgi:hypothetical protein